MSRHRMNCNFERDLPQPHQRKEIIFYRDGLKVYGVLPYLLHRKLNAHFCASLYEDADSEHNFTRVAYAQKPDTVQALVDWLQADAGTEWAIAAPGARLCDTPALDRPETVTPTRTFQQECAFRFGVVVSTNQHTDPIPWAAVLGGLGQRPQPTDAVLGGVDVREKNEQIET